MSAARRKAHRDTQDWRGEDLPNADPFALIGS
jgi:hypothetical protein